MALRPHPFLAQDPLKEQVINYLTNVLWINPDEGMSLPRVLQRMTSQFENKPALLDKKNGSYRSLSYRQMELQSRALAASLIEMGLSFKGRVALLLKNSIDWALSDFGTMFAGATTVPIYLTLTPSAIEYLLKDSTTEILIVEDKTQYKKIQQIRANLPQLRFIIVRNARNVPLDNRTLAFEDLITRGLELLSHHSKTIEDRIASLNRNDIASIVYTSGTTGEPKGAMLTHFNFLSTAYGLASVTDINSYDRFLSILPLSHVFERAFGYYAPLSIGATIAYAEGIETLTDDFLEIQPTICAVVPRIFEKLYSKVTTEIDKGNFLKRFLFHWAERTGQKVWNSWKHDRSGVEKVENYRLRHRAEDRPDRSFTFFSQPLLHSAYWLANGLVYRKIRKKFGSRIRYFVTGGAPLSAKIINFFRNLQIIIYEGYGLTETSPVVSFNYGNSYKLGTIGKLAPHVNVRFSDDGEILVKGPNVMAGYLNKPEATAQAIDAEGWFHTGDVGKFDEEKYLIITDRIKELIVLSTGKNVAPLPIEHKLNQSPLISHVAVIGNNRNFVSALIFPDMLELKSHASSLGFSTDDISKLCSKRDIKNIVSHLVDEANQAFAPYERIKRFEIVPHDIAQDSTLLTPTLKLKRKVVEQKFKDIIARMYTRSV